jgi:F5/8 type C domain-containing protein/putative BNR repeat neuraminidase
MKNLTIILLKFLLIFCIQLPAVQLYAEDYFVNDGHYSSFYRENQRRGIYHNNKTYVCYEGTDGDPWIASYDHGIKSWTGPIKAGTNPLPDTDDHGNPALIMDANGYIHVFYGGHGYNNGGKMRNSKSTNTEDITTWTEKNNVEEIATYPQLHKTADDNILYIYRSGNHRADWVLQTSSDSLNTWSDPPTKILQGGSACSSCSPGDCPEGTECYDAFYAYSRLDDNDKKSLHMVFLYKDDRYKQHCTKNYEKIPIFSVVASDFQERNSPENTIDGDLGTRWSAFGDGQWIEYELSSATSVSHVEIAWYKGEKRKAEFEIQVSGDGSDWYQVYQGESNGTDLNLEPYEFEDIEARYIRIIGYGNKLNDWNSITEVALYTNTTLPEYKYRFHQYYIYRDAYGSWKNAAGDSLQLPISKAYADECCRVFDSFAEEEDYCKNRTMTGTVDVDDEGTPYVGFTVGTKSDFTHKVAQWTDDGWVIMEVGSTTDDQWNEIDMVAHTNTDIDVFLISGNGDYKRGGNVENWHSADGESWYKADTIIANDDDHARPSIIYPHHPDAYLVFSTKGPRDSIWDNKIYLYGDSGFIGRSGSCKKWRLEHVDSFQDSAGGKPAHPGEYAFDCNPSTFWHTEWYPADPLPPHEIQIDLGSSNVIRSFSYLPRQGESENGTIADFEFFVSESTSNWSTPVAKGEFSKSKQSKDVALPAKSGRYIRLVALSEVNNQPWTSIAEIDVVTSDGEDYTKLPIFSISASDFQEGNPPQNTVDGNLSTRWSAPGLGQWIEYDLGATANIAYLEIAWFKGDERNAAFDIEVSADGNDWRQVFSGQSSGTTLNFESCGFNEIAARYIKIIGYGNTRNDWNSITEVAVYGKADYM